MKKAFDQTVRDLKREVNKKVLKVPGIEQKILDATSNEPWGPHGSLLADIANASRNHQEYQIIMHVIWKRLNDIGKNWRHVYKALTVLEYLVGHGTERVIDDIREHAYQISTLSDFQYIDSSGRDQGNNVRRKSQSLVALVNDKEKVKEVREKAMLNKNKYRSTFSTSGRGGGGYGGRYDDDRYEGQYRDGYESRYKDDDRNAYGREKDWGSKDDERYGRGSSPYNRDGNSYGRDSDDQYGRDGYRDDDYRGSRGNDDSFGPRNRSFDRDRDRFSEEDDRYSSRNSAGRLDEPSQEERSFDHKLSEQSPTPSYEEAVKNSHDQVRNGSNGNLIPSTKAYSPPVDKSSPPTGTTQYNNQSATAIHNSIPNKESDQFDEFDPRGSAPASAPAPTNASGPEIDLFSNQSALDSINSLALVPTGFDTTSEADAVAQSGTRAGFVPLSSAATAFNQPPEDPFGDGPFKATTTEGNFNTPATSVQTSQPLAAAAPTFDFGDTLGGLTYSPNTMDGSNVAYQQHFTPNPPPPITTNDYSMPQPQQSFQQQSSQPQSFQQQQSFQPQQQPFPQQQSFQQPQPPPPQQSFPQQQPQQQSFPPQQSFQQPQQSFQQHQSFQQPQQQSFQQPSLQQQHGYQGNMYNAPNVSYVPPQPASSAPHSQQVSHAATTQPTKGKFETKSTVWADTLNRGLVDLNISGAKVNPLIANVGVDFEAINRMDKRKEKSSSALSTPMVSTTSMGKAMGSGSGIGRAGMMGMGMNNQPSMAMGLNQQGPMRPPRGPGMTGYTPGMGMGGYGPQQPYGGGYR